MAELMTPADAVAEHVHDGDTVALERFTHLIPVLRGYLGTDLVKHTDATGWPLRFADDLSTTDEPPPRSWPC